MPDKMKSVNIEGFALMCVVFAVVSCRLGLARGQAGQHGAGGVGLGGRRHGDRWVRQNAGFQAKAFSMRWGSSIFKKKAVAR